jgi:two-component system nitrogen regulation sensor histidine kinase NtrY
VALPSKSTQSAGTPGSPSLLSPEERRRRRRESLSIVAASIAVVVFAFWEIRRPGATDSAPGNVFSFFVVNLNVILLLLLAFLVLRNVLKLFFDRRRRVPGSRLRTRLVAAFAAIALFPATVMLLVSIEFSTNAIDDWFNREVEDSLLGAWRLAQTYYRETGSWAELHADRLSALVADDLSRIERHEASTRELEARLGDYGDSYRLATVRLYDADGRLVLVVPPEAGSQTSTSVVNADLLRRARAGKTAIRVDSRGVTDAVQAAAIVRSDDGRELGSIWVDSTIGADAKLWSEQSLMAFREYRKLKLNKTPFKNVYVLTMALASLVVVFSATWLGLYLARGISEPLGRLVNATRRLASGDWDVELAAEGEDEVGTLVDAFNAMAAELRTSHAALEDRRRYIENILAHIDAGVIAVGADGTVRAVNNAAVFLLGAEAGMAPGASARDVFKRSGYSDAVELLDGLMNQTLPSGTRRSMPHEPDGRTLLVTATTVEGLDGAERGFVLFLEDVSQITATQRMEAWREVARRIAHEIKNPLTPIQLSAQRMQRRLARHLPPDDVAVLDECARTIVAQVEEMKRLVNEFGQFARRAAPDKKRQSLNALIEETLPLFSQARPEISMRFEPGEPLPVIDAHRESVQRMLINLLDNAVAAVSGEMGRTAGAGAEPEIVVRTRHDPALARVCLEVCDSGPGVPSESRARIFEPYFSTRAGGTGLGLAIVASIAADHQAFVRCYENEPAGSRFVVEFPASSAAEGT